jgi:hypothetical protein
MALNEKSKKVFEFVKENQGENITAADIVEGTGLEIRSVNGIVTSAFCKKGLMERIPAEIEVTDAEGKVTHKPVKFIRLTEAGLDFDPDLTEE